ncbi:42693_t:CDS:2, partial [Gigaspora margarita]
MYWEQLQLDYNNDEEILADRAMAPRKNDVFYLYKKHRDKHVGAQNGKEMFDRLAKEIADFNNNNKGKIWMQTYIAPENNDAGQPFILVILTNLMIRCHELRESGELVYMDTTAGLDGLNTPLTILSTCTPAGGLPLGVILTSDESANTFTKALEALKHLIPSMAFGERGSTVGLQVIITDDCTAERTTLNNTWKHATLLLCVFYFLQAMWKWLRDGKHGIHNDDLTSQVYLKYSKFQTHFKASWDRRCEWSIAFCQHLPIRNNNTNNFAEAGIRILKDIIFKRVQAYNVVQLYQFIINTMDLYYIRRLLAVAHNNLNSFIALRFRLSEWPIGPKDDIEIVNQNSMVFRHRSGTLLICDLELVTQVLDFYAGLHQKQLEEENDIYLMTDEELNISSFTVNDININNDSKIDVNNSNRDSYISDVDNNESNNNNSYINDTDDNENAIDKLHWFYNDLENLLEQNDHALNSAVASFLQTCGWEAGRVNGSIYKRGGKKIRVQVAAASRRKVGLNRGLNKVRQGRPRNNSKVNTEMQEPNRSIMPARKRCVKKRPHNLYQALKENRPNGV